MAAEEKKSQIRTCVSCGLEVEGDATACPADGGMLTVAVQDPLIGLVLMDKYEVHSILGRGGMSAVYKARHILMDRWVALKVLRSDLVHDPLVLKRFQVESKAASLLRHPNAVTVYDFGVIPDIGIPYLVMDYLEGRDVSTIVREERQIAPARCANLMIQACAALAHAHAKGVIHRDIKPSNLLVTVEEDGLERLRVVDFGIAKILSPEGSDMTKLTTTGDIFGSPAYMSPEQCHGMVADARSDIYSLGGVIYECLTGTAPLHGQSTIDMILKQVHDMPPSFGVVRPDLKIPGALEAVVFKAVAKNPEHRYATMAELSTGLSEAMASAAPTKKAATTVSGFSVIDEQQSFDRTRPAMSAKAPDIVSERLTNGEEGGPGPSIDVRPGPPAMIGSFDLFGNQMLMPAASDDSIAPHTQKSEKVRQDVGNLFGAESIQPAAPGAPAAPDAPRGDSGRLFAAADADLKDVGNLFGTQHLLPAAADAPKGDSGKLFDRIDDVELKDVGNIFGTEKLLPSAPVHRTDVAKTGGDRGGLIVDPQSSPRDSFSNTTGGGATGNATPNQGGGNINRDQGAANITRNQGAANISRDQGATISPPAGNPSTVTIAVVAVGTIVALAAGAIAVIKFVPAVKDSVATNAAWLAGPLGIETTSSKPPAHNVPGTRDTAANSIYQSVRNSIVSLVIKSKAYQVVFKGTALLDKQGEKIYAAKDKDGKVGLYQNGKLAPYVEGSQGSGKDKVLFGIKLVGGELAMVLTAPGTNQILKKPNGDPILLTEGLELQPVVAKSTASGFYVRPDVVCTVAECVMNPLVETTTTWDSGTAQIGNQPGRIELEKEPIAVDKKHHLALLNIPSNDAKGLELLSDYSQLQPGDPVYSVGAPDGFELSMDNGVISASKLRDGGDDAPKLFIQHSARIDKGNAGGPLFNAKGEVIGVNALVVGNGSINLAIAAKYVADLLAEADVEKKVQAIADERKPDLGK